jgi:N,N'-diacetyllegionaminate synthase
VRTEIIVEIANTHEGSLGIAASLVDMAASSGADAVKFQMHLGEHEGVIDEPFRVNFSVQDKSRRDYWDRVGLTDEGWSYLSDYCSRKGVEFICTPFSVEAASRLLQFTDVKRWKVGSGDAPNFPFIDHLVTTGLPLIISTGLLAWDEILKLRERLQDANAWERTILMHCVTMYPTPLEYSSLNLLDDLIALGGRVGLSDHSGRLTPSIYALSKGVEIIEVHMTPHPQFFGPDVTSSLTPAMVEQLIIYRNEFQTLRENPAIKSTLFDLASDNRRLFRKGIYWKTDLQINEKCTLENFSFLKPSVGIDAIDFENYIGKTLKHSVKKGDALTNENFHAT